MGSGWRWRGGPGDLAFGSSHREGVGRTLMGAGGEGGWAGRTPTEQQGEEAAQKQLILLVELFL